MFRIFTVFCFSLLLLFPAKAQSAGLKLSFEIQSHTDKPETLIKMGAKGGTTVLPKDTTKDIDVLLYPRSFVINDGASSTIYDFDKRQMLVVNQSEQTITPVSLFSIVVFRDLERRNRLGIASIFDAAKIKPNADNPDLQIVRPVDIDMIFGSESNAKDTGAKIEKATAGGKTTFKSGTELANYTVSEVGVPAELQDSYKKFLLYYLQIHPVIKSSLSAEGRIFKSLEVNNNANYASSRNNYTFKNSIPVPENTYVLPQNFKAQAVQVPSLNVVMQKANATQSLSVDGYESKIENSIQSKQYVDAALGLNELLLAHSGKVELYKPFLKKNVPVILQDKQAAMLMSAISSKPNSEEMLNNIISFMQTAKPQAREFGYLMDLFMANHIRTVYGQMRSLNAEQSQKMANTIPMFISALEGNPRIAGIYVDLGNAYFKDFEMSNAWACWDQARLIDPDFPALANVKSFQDNALKNFPEFF